MHLSKYGLRSWVFDLEIPHFFHICKPTVLHASMLLCFDSEKDRMAANTFILDYNFGKPNSIDINKGSSPLLSSPLLSLL